jgi:pentatricopeptide repeat protein
LVTYTTLVDAYALAGDMEKARATLQRMVRRKLHPNRLTYTCMVAGYGRRGMADAALGMLEEARARCGEPDEELYTAAIVAAVGGDRVEAAVALAEEMKSAGCDLPVVLNMLMLRAGLVERSGEELSSLLKAIEALGITPTRAACESLVDVLAVEGNVTGAFGVLPTMRRFGYPPNLRTYKKLIECCGVAQDAARAQKLFDLLRGSGSTSGRPVHRTHHWVQLYEAILIVVAQTGDNDAVERYLEGMRCDCGRAYAETMEARVRSYDPGPGT